MSGSFGVQRPSAQRILVELPVVADVIDVLRAAGVRRAPAGPQIGPGGWRSAGGGQVVMVPAVAVPPELVDVMVGADVVNVLRAVEVADVGSGRVAERRRRSGLLREVVVVPAGRVQPQLVDVEILAPRSGLPDVDDVPGPLGCESVTGGGHDSTHRARRSVG